MTAPPLDDPAVHLWPTLTPRAIGEMDEQRVSDVAQASLRVLECVRHGDRVDPSNLEGALATIANLAVCKESSGTLLRVPGLLDELIRFAGSPEAPFRQRGVAFDALQGLAFYDQSELLKHPELFDAALDACGSWTLARPALQLLANLTFGAERLHPRAEDLVARACQPPPRGFAEQAALGVVVNLVSVQDFDASLSERAREHVLAFLETHVARPCFKGCRVLALTGLHHLASRHEGRRLIARHGDVVETVIDAARLRDPQVVTACVLVLQALASEEELIRDLVPRKGLLTVLVAASYGNTVEPAVGTILNLVQTEEGRRAVLADSKVQARLRSVASSDSRVVSTLARMALVFLVDPDKAVTGDEVNAQLSLAQDDLEGIVKRLDDAARGSRTDDVVFPPWIPAAALRIVSLSNLSCEVLVLRTDAVDVIRQALSSSVRDRDSKTSLFLAETIHRTIERSSSRALALKRGSFETLLAVDVSGAGAGETWDAVKRRLGESRAHLVKREPLQPKYDVFISHHKGSSGVEARLLADRLASGGFFSRERIFLDVETGLEDISQLGQYVRESSVLVLLLTNETLTRPFVLAETYTALMSDVRVVPIELAGKKYDFNAALKFLRDHFKRNLERANPGAVDRLERAGINVDHMGRTILKKLPELIAISVDFNAQELILKGMVEQVALRIRNPL